MESSDSITFDDVQKFWLYQTFARYYIVGRGRKKTSWKVLIIDRMEPSELNIFEDPTTYTAEECSDLLKTLHQGNRSMGGLKLVTIGYGIVGFIRFLEPYYMLIITERKNMGSMLGAKVYGISKSRMVIIPNPVVRTKKAYCNTEKRYQKLLNSVDLTKDFFFSYSYQVMRSLQDNLSKNKMDQNIYKSMFVWNEFLTRGIRKQLKNNIWTVALVYGFFKQIKLSISGRGFDLTLIARRSRHYAGTRFLRRGVNDKGKVANDVETEQIVSQSTFEGQVMQISSIVQNRGSIPVFWSQETSLLKIFNPVVIIPKQGDYGATKLHFKNLADRYGNPIIILDLTKTREKKPRETLLHAEYVNAIGCINAECSEENRLKLLQWDLKQHSRSEASTVLSKLKDLTKLALDLNGTFYCQVTRNSSSDGSSRPYLENVNISENNNNGSDDANGKCDVKIKRFQKGVLRTNCFDCLDRTNIAQYAYGLAALGQQLQTFGYLESSDIDLDDPIARHLMDIYEIMGDKLAMQYGGSPAHNKIFSERRGQWKPAIEYVDIVKSVQRFVSNVYMDEEKQNGIDLFLGNPPPQKRKLVLDPDKHNKWRRTMKRSLSDSNIIMENDISAEEGDGEQEQLSHEESFGVGGHNIGLLELMPQISTYCRYTGPEFPEVVSSSESVDTDHEEIRQRATSRFLTADWYSESVYSCEEDLYNKILNFSGDNVDYYSIHMFDFGRWITRGGTFYI
ncbi:phosphoinositide phosphatase SAC2-like [Momordica charantia]|uniref:Phosphoinositide phosphatase SAC2-like n=1 Tax=Momordica charantia TaxID=3673 RepID=A0A6J1CYY6_MOMCH|nr:phosphoinositide phosphatase SAC2-like [Momordica charantia]XP_022146594.1 phosphoinositide phosphatase SAC2-like [Momordica charantia]